MRARVGPRSLRRFGPAVGATPCALDTDRYVRSATALLPVRMRILLLAAGLAFAQSPAPGTTPPPVGATPSSGAPSDGAPSGATPSEGARPDHAAFDAAVVRALDLPFAARKLRDAGVPEADVRGSLGAMRGAGVAAGDATEVAEATATQVTEHGPVDNFGAFVQERLASGLRGRELADAIAAEHAARGKGKKGAPSEHAGGAGHEHGKAGAHGDEHGKAGGHGKADDAHAEAGRAGEKGAPDGKRAPDGKGAPEDKGGRPEGAGQGGAHGKSGEKKEK